MIFLHAVWNKLALVNFNDNKLHLPYVLVQFGQPLKNLLALICLK